MSQLASSKKIRESNIIQKIYQIIPGKNRLVACRACRAMPSQVVVVLTNFVVGVEDEALMTLEEKMIPSRPVPVAKQLDRVMEGTSGEEFKFILVASHIPFKFNAKYY